MSNLREDEMATEQNYREYVRAMAEQVVAILREDGVTGPDPITWLEAADLVKGSRWVDQPYYAQRLLLWSACADAVFDAEIPQWHTCMSMGDIYCKAAWFAMVGDVANAASDLWEVLS